MATAFVRSDTPGEDLRLLRMLSRSPTAARALEYDTRVQADELKHTQQQLKHTQQQVKGRTALMSASCMSPTLALSAAVRCLKLGADVNARDANGTTALMFAAREGDSHAPVVALLLGAGADPQLEEDTQLLTALGMALTAGAHVAGVKVARDGPLLRLLTEACGEEDSHAQMQWAVLLDEARRAGWLRPDGTVRPPGPLDRDEVDECRRALGQVLANRERG